MSKQEDAAFADLDPVAVAVEIVERHAYLLALADSLSLDFDDPLEIAVNLFMAAEGVRAHVARRQLESEAWSAGITLSECSRRYTDSLQG